MTSRANIVVSIVAVLALIAPASASAGWSIEGGEVSGTAALATTAKVDHEIVLKGAGTTVTCNGNSLNSAAPEIAAPNKLNATDIAFTGCKAGTPCSLSKSEIKTEPITGELTEEGSASDTAVLQPKTGTRFASITFEGAECALAGEQLLKGKAKALLPTGQTESEAQAVNLITTEASKELTLGASGVSLEGSALFRLASGKELAFFAPSRLFEFSVSQSKKIVTFTIKKRAMTPAAKVNAIGVAQNPAGEWNLKGNDYKGCEGNYPEKGSCSFEVEYTNANGAPTAIIVFSLVDENGDHAVSRFQCSPAACPT